VKPRVAIATGDPAGIGPEISLKAAADPQVLAMCEPVLIDGRGPVAALDAAETAIRGALEGRFDAVVAAPHVEATIHAAGVAFDGYPSFVARVCGLPPEDGVLMLCFTHRGRDIRIAHVTLHASVRQALDQISAPRILRTLQAAHLSLRNLGIERPRLAVGGVNPHAGEGGLFGHEEERVLRPAAEAAGLIGPLPADTVFVRAMKGEFDAVLAPYHDVGMTAIKVASFGKGVNVTLGLPVPRTAPDHGTAVDIAGKGTADPSSMKEAIRVAQEIARRQ
jgi:4-hydroxythreonine-4-phosphate dehydrogenase